MADCSNSSLALLGAYLSDGSSDEEIPGPKVSTKRQASKDWPDQNPSKKMSSDGDEEKLPLPSPLMSFIPSSKNKVDNPVEHDGRIRSFPHERGNWSTYVYIPFEPGPAVSSFVDVVLECCKTTVVLKPVDEHHISLTRTVVLRHHWIDSFFESVRLCIKELPSFSLSFDSVGVYCNEEKTRTFIGLTVAAGHKSLIAVVNVLNKCLADFRLPPFYKEPSFHMSIAWCVGNYVEQIERDVLPQLQVAFQHFMHAQYDQWKLHVVQLHCKCGNKLCTFQLAN
ncbi:U6 snRNA phosphodiesterase [Cryptotermes secundus]|uniref:U6 snRNA phosphodiesterase n=1 Tax=Cryptotermes secundus TaxID=105785 RepID=A0A2J7RQZ9_9NEOP|nr:U6 snRNA phosphodiesterase [Cryptotermes secundus]XP_033607043.1 U6 snRNA phosphodiesterase [Cryptotermes secundus]PNF43255.1 U6 snRNA phosphodiesterase [Cryptotermes secundus]PNF43256.1 U6 snRNA phosphodiesterase [Cryptotermes secundus]